VISELRPYQLDALRAIRDSIRGGVRRLVVQAATGAGKTKIAAAMVDSALSKGNRTAFVVPSISLIDQTVEQFWAEGIRDIGVIQAGHAMTDWSKPVQVCSIQTVQARGVFPETRAVIFDECHRLFVAHKKWMADSPHTPFIGLSATPWTKGLGKHFETLLVAATTTELIEQGYLSPFRVFATGHPDLSSVRTVGGDYHEGELSGAMQTGELTADIIRTWQAKWGKPKTLVFAVDCAHARSIQDRFERAGFAFGYQDAHTPADARKEIKRKFHSEEYYGVVNVETLTTGTDWDVRCIILGRPTQSEILFTQIVGRGLRTADGKDYLLLLDHSNTTQTLGFVTDIHHDCLDNGEKKSRAEVGNKPPLPKECNNCSFLKPPRTPICPNCGQQSKPACDMVENDGELVELTVDRKATSKRRTAADWPERERRAFFSELKAYALEQRDYKPGWAAAKYREKFSVWPPRSFDVVPPAVEVSPAIASWIKSSNIRWAKGRARQAEKAHA
jgi:superfamily II DNA or RNA helicase